MKWLIGLSAIQAFLLAVLGLRVAALDARTIELAEAAAVAKPAATSDRARAESQWTWPSKADAGATITADEIRSIFREELAALQEKANATGADAPREAAPASRVTQEEARRLKASYDQDLSYYRSRGAINDREMADLQMKIAQLPRAERRAALSDLARAMSTGEIDGRM